MTIFWQVNLLDKIYNSPIGVSATLTSAGGQSATVTVVDKTAGISIPDARTQIDTIRPIAMVRARELETAGISMSDLSEGSIAFNGAIWRIKDYRPVPSPEGETDGEIMLILLFEV